MSLIANGPDVIRILDRNMKVGRSSETVFRELENDIKEYDPHILTLQECSGYHRVLEKLAKKYGYRELITAKGSVEGRSTVMMVKQSLPMKRKRVNRLKVKWKGPKMGRWHLGRRLPLAVVALGNRWVRVRSIHGSTGALMKRNVAAWREMMVLLTQNAMRRGPFFFDGDWNWPFHRTGALSPRAMAKKVGAQMTLGGVRIEYAVHRGLKVTAKKLPKNGSDHHGVLYTIRLA